MGLKKHGVVVGCEHCRYQTKGGVGGFDVIVPLCDTSSGTKGIARLRCSVSSSRHAVELKQWHDNRQQPIKPSAEIMKRLSQALDFVAGKRICGNRHLCPPEVVRIVEQDTRG
jgi:hypothetical protein